MTADEVRWVVGLWSLPLSLPLLSWKVYELIVMHEEDCFSVKWGERGCGQAEGLRNSYIVVSRDAIGEEGSVVSQDSREVVGGDLNRDLL